MLSLNIASIYYYNRMVNFFKKGVSPIIINSTRLNKEGEFYEFSFSQTIDKLLSSSLKKKITWKSAHTVGMPKGELFKIWSGIPGAHKWHHYFPIYEKLLTEFRNRPIKILEIGIYKGASLSMWKQYFHQDSTIVGIDIDPDCKKFSKPDKNIHIKIGSQADNNFLESIVEEFGVFDLIIDDGSHISSHMIKSFNSLFDFGLKSQGLYLVEDTHSNFWNSPYRDIPVSFVDFSKYLIDLMHYHYTQGINENQYRLNSETKIESFEVPYITCLIEEIRYFDSIIAIYKTENRALPISEHL